MEFLVNIRIKWPEGMSAQELERISVEERHKARELQASGHMVRMWRVPGRRENWGLWRAADATELHAKIASLPVFPFMDVTVHPLAWHPVDPTRPAEIDAC